MKKVGISVLLISLIIIIVGLNKYYSVSELPISETTILMEMYNPGIIDRTEKKVDDNHESGTYIIIEGFCLGILGVGIFNANSKKEIND